MRTINGLSWSFHFEYGWFLEMLGLILHDSLSFSVATFIPDDSFFHSQWWLISLMIPSHSQWWHGLCCRHCRLQAKNVSLSHSSSQVQRSNIAIAANLCRFQIRIQNKVILCSPNASESLINAASESHNFQVILPVLSWEQNSLRVSFSLTFLSYHSNLHLMSIRSCLRQYPAD